MRSWFRIHNRHTNRHLRQIAAPLPHLQPSGSYCPTYNRSSTIHHLHLDKFSAYCSLYRPYYNFLLMLWLNWDYRNEESIRQRPCLRNSYPYHRHRKAHLNKLLQSLNPLQASGCRKVRLDIRQDQESWKHSSCRARGVHRHRPRLWLWL